VNPKLLRLVLAAVLFAAWMGYLGYLVYALPRPPQGNNLPVVLSRPQFLVSEVDVIGSINLKDGTVKVAEVLFPPNAEKPAKGEEIKVVNLDKVNPLLKEQANLGACLIPLQATDNGMYRVVNVPVTPGFYVADDARVYPVTAETLAQYEQLQKSKLQKPKEPLKPAPEN
jgi:hypothetical protein